MSMASERSRAPNTQPCATCHRLDLRLRIRVAWELKVLGRRDSQLETRRWGNFTSGRVRRVATEPALSNRCGFAQQWQATHRTQRRPALRANRKEVLCYQTTSRSYCLKNKRRFR